MIIIICMRSEYEGEKHFSMQRKFVIIFKSLSKQMRYLGLEMSPSPCLPAVSPGELMALSSGSGPFQREEI